MVLDVYCSGSKHLNLKCGVELNYIHPIHCLLLCYLSHNYISLTLLLSGIAKGLTNSGKNMRHTDLCLSTLNSPSLSLDLFH